MIYAAGITWETLVLSRCFIWCGCIFSSSRERPLSCRQSLVSARRYCYARETESKFLWWSRHTFCLFSHVIAVLYKQLIMQFLSLLEACSGWSAMTNKAQDLAALGSHSVMVLERGTSSLMGSFSSVSGAITMLVPLSLANVWLISFLLFHSTNTSSIWSTMR